MDASVMFVELSGIHGQERFGQVRAAGRGGRPEPDEVKGGHSKRSNPVPRGHWFNGPVESLTLEERPDVSEAIARLKGAPVRPPGS